jgi:hypothetical protein
MRSKPKQNTETISCADCSNLVSFSARYCPHCGSIEPSGPYIFSARETHRHRIEYRNDRNLAISAVAFGTLGAAYGFATSTSTIGAFFAVGTYGLFGILVGVPVGCAINFMRGW